MTIYILIASVIILACILSNKISNKLGIPTLLLFILLGMVFGSDGILRIPFDNFRFAESICSFALIFIMFYGGFGTKWSAARPVFVPAVLLSTIGVILTAGITGVFCHFVLKMNLAESFLLGALISSTDAASVFSILRSRRLNLKYNTASLLEVESGSNDPCAYMLTTILLLFAGGDTPGTGTLIYSVFAQIFYGVLAGVLAAFLTVFVLRKFQFTTQGFDTIFVFAIVLLSYAVPSVIGGNGYLSAYIFGIILGNQDLGNKKAYVSFFDGLTGLMQMLVFFLLGLLSFPSRIPGVILPAILIALFLTFVARPIAVGLLLTPFKCRLNQQLLVSFAGLRGAASIVFAIMVMISPSYDGSDVFHIIFCIVLFSILFQGTLLPFMAKKLDMIDENEDVLKTFTDYTDEVPVQFIQFTVQKNHPWEGSMLKDILLPPETLLVQIEKKTGPVTPNGNTVLEEGDILVLSARASGKVNNVKLTELTLEKGNKWIGKPLSGVSPGKGKLVVMIQRNGDIVIPNGSTVLMEQDLLVIKEG